MRQFFDTNVLVYSRDSQDRVKRDIARMLIAKAIEADAFVISIQVLVEFYRTVIRRNFLAPPEALNLVRLWSEHDTVAHTSELLIRGLVLHQAHSLSIWDALIVQAALDARCDVVLTEDLQHGRRFGDLEISNPFLSGAREPRGAYRTRGRKREAATARR